MKRRPKKDIRFSLREGIARIVLSGTAPGNRFTPEMAIAFSEACERCEDDDCRVVLLYARGPSFCRGLASPYEEWPRVAGTDFVSALAKVTRPVVVVIRGRAEAEGFELALAADLRILSATARLALPQVERGTLPRFGATQRLPRIVGAERALRIILLGHEMRAREALATGLATSVVRDPEAAGEKLARTVARRAPVALRFAKEAVRRAHDLALDDGARFEHDLYALLQTTEDRAEGIRAFLEKRVPRFKGR
jgi:enoyl-CoA hydratase/carnithine racemase